eukprot:jgi/Botrbrau1/22373/Bobra.0002s0050.1
MGVFATRTPHRPVPIGLSIAKIEERRGGSLLVSGVDIVDGSPVLDVKPYVPFCDSLPFAVAPSWVAREAPAEPLRVASVRIDELAQRRLREAWILNRQQGRQRGEGPLYPDFQDFRRLVEEVLSRDIRSVHQRGGAPRTGVRSELSKAEVTASRDPQHSEPNRACRGSGMGRREHEGGKVVDCADSSSNVNPRIVQDCADVRGEGEGTPQSLWKCLEALEGRLDVGRDLVKEEPGEMFRGVGPSALYLGEPPTDESEFAFEGRYKIILEGVQVGYDMDENGHVLVQSAQTVNANVGCKPAL